jgi:hypothetical protein
VSESTRIVYGDRRRRRTHPLEKSGRAYVYFVLWHTEGEPSCVVAACADFDTASRLADEHQEEYKSTDGHTFEVDWAELR